MTIKIGDTLPEGTLAEFIESETEGCALGPNTFNVQDLVKGKKIAIFGLPGAYTPTCSAQHVPVRAARCHLKAKGVDESVHLRQRCVRDGRLGPRPESHRVVRMMADGNAAYSKALGLDADSPARHGTRSHAYSMWSTMAS